MKIDEIETRIEESFVDDKYWIERRNYLREKT